MKLFETLLLQEPDLNEVGDPSIKPVIRKSAIELNVVNLRKGLGNI